MGLIVVGRITKRAQTPFSAWLPAAMAAPTPVSALVHSSTLVTAGVYVIYRYIYCVEGSFVVYLVFVSLLTMFMSGLVAVAEIDVKKIVAYSTMRQLGVIILALRAVVTKEVGMYHLLVHAYYKSLMFLCVGCAIYKGAGRQDSRFSRVMWTKMPVVAGWLVVACLSLSALPFTSGYWSKHAVVEGRVYGEVRVFASVVICVSVLVTSFYSFRLAQLLFFRGSNNTVSRAYSPDFIESASNRLFIYFPLNVLGVASIMVGPFLRRSFNFLDIPLHRPY